MQRRYQTLYLSRGNQVSNKQELMDRYQQSAVAMGRFMREAGEHIASNEEMDLSPADLIEEINSIQAMLNEAKYYATRMQVYATLLGHGRDKGDHFAYPEKG